MKDKNKIITVFLIVFICICSGFCIYKLTDRDDVIYAETADTGFGSKTERIAQNVIKVDIEGAVKKPGLITLKGDKDRLGDAIKSAGGLKRNADRSQINLAAHLSDGMKIVIPLIGEELTAETGTTEKNGFAGKININTADSEELQKIPGIGPAYAQRIIEYRENIGSFREPNDLLAIKGIGEKRLANMKQYIKF